MITRQWVIDMLAGDGLNPEPGRLPDSVARGPFAFACDLGTALTAGQSVVDLTTAALNSSASLSALGFASNNPDITLFVTQKMLVLGGALVDALDSGDLAQLAASLQLHSKSNLTEQFSPFTPRSVVTPRVMTQQTQGTAANGSFGSTASGIPSPVAPMMVVDLSIDTLELYAFLAVTTFAGSANLNESRLWLSGYAVQNSALRQGGANGRGDACAKVVSPKSRVIGGRPPMPLPI